MIDSMSSIALATLGFFKVVGAIFLVIVVIVILLSLIVPSLHGSSAPLKYHQIKPRLKSGDVILYTGGFFDQFPIRILEKCPVIHAGMVFKDKTGILGKIGKLYILEANIDIKFDYITKQKDLEDGCVASDLDLTIKNNRNYIWLPLNHGVNEPQLCSIIQKFPKFKLSDDIFKWYSKIYMKNNKGVEDGKTCAELVAYIYYKLGIFCNSPPIYTYSPCQYYCNRNLGFINGYKFKGRYIFSI
jgi:hypothetical protein